jgi:hypothetical protein
MSGGFASSQILQGRLTDEQATIERRIALERARTVPDEPLLRRLQRERTLARDRLAALSGPVMPPWARADRP